MGLSSNSLVHLTKEKDSLLGILKHEFKFKYCLEQINTPTAMFNAAFPMVSFCDIPLSEIKNHITNYGMYGIGLKKEWAKAKGLNPVLYIANTSTLAQDFKNAAIALLSGKEDTDYNETDAAIIDLLRYMKNYEGDLTRNGKTILNYRFSDEREWRLIPNRKDALQFLPPNLYDTVEKKEMQNAKLSKLSLGFEPNDISYIIIKDDSEISEFIRAVEEIKGTNHHFNDVKRLTTRIITTEQILNDF